MSGKLDQSLDEIMKDTKPSGGRRGRGDRQPARKAKAATGATAPAGGIQKKGGAKATAAAANVKKAATAMAAVTGESKISVSNLPEDVTESHIKDFFVSAVGPVKKVILNYGPSGRSRGSATVLFNKPTAAAEAVKLHGTPVDGKPLRIELLVGAKGVAKPAPAKTLQERISKPKNTTQNKPKPVTKGVANGSANVAAKGGRAARTGKKNAGRTGKPKAKTTEELDAEMQDYFGQPNGATNGAAQPTANGGDTMDEVL